MGNRWRDEGPPDEAYSRCTRDLAAVTAGFRAYVAAVVGGFREYRRVERGEVMLGFEWSGGGQATGDPGAPPVDLWQVDWPAWPSRGARLNTKI